MPSTRILVADDHSLVRRGVRALLETQREWTICGEATTGAEAILKAKRLRPDIIVMDISMPEVNGLEATRQIHAEMPETPVLILTMHDSDQFVREVLDAGARGYVLKSDLDRNLFLAIQALRQGKTYFSAKVSEIVLEGFMRTHAARPPRAKGQSPELTSRQKEIVRLLPRARSTRKWRMLWGSPPKPWKPTAPKSCTSWGCAPSATWCDTP